MTSFLFMLGGFMKLSIIIPYYNTKVYTDELLQLLDKQVNNDVEVLLIDDGSKEPYQSNYEWLQIIRKENGGVSSARNVGLDKSKGDYIAFIDSDDLIADNYIESIINKIDKEHFDYLYMSWKAFGTWNETIKLNKLTDEFPEWNLCCWNRVYKKELISNIRFNEKKLISEDAEFIRDVQRVCFKKSIISDMIYLYRGGRPNSLTQSYGQGKLDFKRIVYHYKRITKDMTWLLDEVKELNKENEVIILTNNNEIPELKNFAMVMTPKYVKGDELRGEPTPHFAKVKRPIKKQVIVYTSVLQKIGGIETFLYNWFLQMKDKYEIMFLYENVPAIQLNRYKQIVECQKYNPNDSYICDTFIIQRIFYDKKPSNVECNQIIQMVHAINTQKKYHIELRDNQKIIAPSQKAIESFDECNEANSKVIQNLTIQKEKRKLLKLISATRFGSDKGNLLNRIESLANQLNNANIPFIWLVFTDRTDALKNIKGLIPMQEQLDISDYINEADYLVQLSDAESFCYSIVEALELGTPVITTPISVLDEINVVDGENAIVIPFDMQDVDVERIYNSNLEFEYKLNNKKSIKEWCELLGEQKPFEKYIYDGGIIVKIKTIRTYRDAEKDIVFNVGDINETTKERADVIVAKGFAQYVEEPIVETAKKIIVEEKTEEEKVTESKSIKRKPTAKKVK